MRSFRKTGSSVYYIYCELYDLDLFIPTGNRHHCCKMHGVPDECIGICIGAIGSCHLITKIEIHIKLHTVCGQYVHIATNICCNSEGGTSVTPLYTGVVPLLSTSVKKAFDGRYRYRYYSTIYASNHYL